MGISMRYLLISLAILICFVIWSRVNRRLFTDFFSPFNLLFFGWILPLSVRGFGLSEFEQDWGTDFILILAWVTLCLIFTSLSVRLVMRARRFSAQHAVFARTVAVFQNRILLGLVGLLFAICFSFYIYGEFITNPVGIPLLYALRTGGTGGFAHHWGKYGPFAVFTGLLYVLTPMLYLGGRVNRRKSRKFMLLLLTTLFPIMAVLKLARVDLVAVGLPLVLVEYYYRHYMLPPGPRRSWIKKYALVGLASLLVVSFFSGLVAIRSGTNDTYRIGDFVGFKLEAGPLFEPLAQVYIYFALPFENLYRFYISYTGGYNWGMSVFRPFLSVTGQGDLADQIASQVDFNVMSGAANQSTFAAWVYAELGLLGLAVVPLVYGSLVNVLYARFRAKPNGVRFFVYLNFTYPWLWLYVTNGFGVLSFYLNAVFILWLFLVYGVLVSVGKQKVSPTASLTTEVFNRLART